MKYALSLVLGWMILLSCGRIEQVASPISLEGSWKMIEVRDRVNNMAEYKPSSIAGDVVIRFMPAGASGGTFTGHTPTNVFGRDLYFLTSDNDLTIPGITMTKVAETSWGNHFIENVRSTSKVLIEKQILHIQTPARILRFQKQ